MVIGAHAGLISKIDFDPDFRKGLPFSLFYRLWFLLICPVKGQLRSQMQIALGSTDKNITEVHVEFATNQSTRPIPC